MDRFRAGRFTELPGSARDAVLVAAVDPVNELAEILAATTQFSTALQAETLSRRQAAHAALAQVPAGEPSRSAAARPCPRSPTCSAPPS